MSALASQFPADNLHATDLPYRLSSWAFDCPDNIGLWFDDRQQLIAWAALQPPFWTIDYAYHPDSDPGLHRQILAWADRRAALAANTQYGRPAWYVMVLAGQNDRIQDLEAAGFACQADVGENSWSKVLMARPALLPVAADTLPAGFNIRPLAGEDESEVEAHVELHRAVFESKEADLVYVETDNYRNAAYEVYRPVGFRVIQDVLVFRKDYRSAQG